MRKRVANKVMPKKVKCIRCGVCCILAPCSESNDARVCSYLTIYKAGYTFCEYIAKNGNPFANGCFLRRSSKSYEYLRAKAEEKVEIKLVGIKEAQNV